MIDGVSGVGVLLALLDTSPAPVARFLPPLEWAARPHPGMLQFLGEAVLFALSEAASYMVGSIIRVGGGR